MGCVCQSETASKDAAIDEYLEKKEAVEKKLNRLLLIGPGATGKSTLFQALQIAHNGSLSTDEKEAVRSIIRSNLVKGIHILIEQSRNLYNKDEIKFAKCNLYEGNDEELRENISIINSYMKEFKCFEENEIDYNEMSKLSDVINYFWNDVEAIKETYINHDKYFAFDDNLEFFLQKVDTIMSSDYIPTEEDCLKNRARTTGMTEYKYDISIKVSNNNNSQSKSFKFEIMDIGGQRNERRKWIHHFENINALLYVASLIDFNGVLFEDSQTNCMIESVTLFQDTSKLKWFEKASMILILNKNDLFKNLLSTIKGRKSLEYCFSEKGNWPNKDEYVKNHQLIHQYTNATLDKNSNEFNQYCLRVTEFLKNIFLSRNESNNKIFVHVTTALETKIVFSLFNDIQQLILRSNLKSIGMHTNQNHNNNINNTTTNNNNSNKHPTLGVNDLRVHSASCSEVSQNNNAAS